MIALLLALSFTQGEVLSHVLSVCLAKEDAIEVVRTHAEKGMDAARAAFAAKEKCDAVPVSGLRVGNVVFSAKTDAGETRVVEIKGPEGVVAYFLTTAPYHEANEPKERGGKS